MDNSQYLENDNIEIDFQEEDLEIPSGHNTYAEFNKKMIEPAQLIYKDNGIFNINKNIIEFIRSINDELIIVAITGKCKTGKSSLTNLLINSNNTQNKNSAVIYYLNISIK